MPHVVTQSCVGDGSCVHACPVNCIQPTPDDPAFELTDMLHVDPATCVDCGACVTACPVDAIKPDWRLDEHERAFVAINAAYHREARPRPLMAPVRPPLVVRRRPAPPRVAIVGSGPAAMYAADEILTIPRAQVTVLERLTQPDGLVRTGVAPDHRRTRRIGRQLDAIRRHPRLTLRLGVDVGRDVTVDELLATHHAVIHAVGATDDRRLDVPGADRPGVLSVSALVGWYNGHPDHAGTTVDLSHPRVVVIGNGNVALDVARILTTDPDALADTAIAPAALDALRRSAVEEVVVVGRRGPEHAAFTLSELVGLRSTPGASVTARPADLHGVAGDDPRLDVLREIAASPTGPGRRIALRFGLAPIAILGHQANERVTGGHAGDRVPGRDDAATGVRLDGARGTETIAAGLVVPAIGFRGRPTPGLPFDASRGTVPHDEGRVVDPATGTPVPGRYVVGWIKRGPTGSIGTNRACAQQTVAALVDDYNAGRLRDPTSPAPTTPARGPVARALQAVRG
ncbi:MAG: 4Fe-4S binding protein [Solirubrobacteraceae bacterium]|nr:4Fe-4S binding protein [Solirubrobacteraceae bacterium]